MDQKKCPQCGTTFEGRSNRLYCSDSCKQSAFQQNQQNASYHQERKPETRLNRQMRVRNDAASAKAEVEIARLRFANEEKLKALDAKERHRERQHELIRQEREFDQQQQLADANSEATKQAWSKERKDLISRLDGLENQLTVKLIVEEKQEPEEEKSDSESLAPLLWFAGGALAVGLLMKMQKPQPELVNPFQSRPKQSSSQVSSGLKNGL